MNIVWFWALYYPIPEMVMSSLFSLARTFFLKYLLLALYTTRAVKTGHRVGFGSGHLGSRVMIRSGRVGSIFHSGWVRVRSGRFQVGSYRVFSYPGFRSGSSRVTFRSGLISGSGLIGSGLSRFVADNFGFGSYRVGFKSVCNTVIFGFGS